MVTEEMTKAKETKKVKKGKVCENCSGLGLNPENQERSCPVCDGAGEVA